MKQIDAAITPISIAPTITVVAFCGVTPMAGGHYKFVWTVRIVEERLRRHMLPSRTCSVAAAQGHSADIAI